MDNKVPASVVILTKNEETRITPCLQSVTWADEIIVVDDESSDRTIEIAKQFTDKVFVKKMEVEGRHRNWAYDQAKHTWILSLDADELITPELKDEIAQTLSNKPKENGFTIPRRNFIGVHWIKHGGWYPSPQLRLFQKDKFRYEEVAVHPRAFMPDPCGHLKCDMIHYSYRSLEDFWAKLNNQTTREAQKWFDQHKAMRLGRFLYRTLDRFIRTYFVKQGFKDGFLGFVVAFNAGLYQFLSYLKYREIILNNRQSETKLIFLDRDGVINQYPGDKEYVKSLQEFKLLPNIKPALKKISDKGYKLFVISNQAGVSKGVYTQANLDAITNHMLSELEQAGIKIEKVYYCTHRPEDNCNCRKPQAGLLHQAIEQLKIRGQVVNIAQSYFIGDTIGDIQTGKSIGCKTILVFSGKEKAQESANWQVMPDYTALDLLDAVNRLIP